MHSTVLLLTACISPGGMAYTEVQNPEIRRKSYIETIRYYLQTTCFRIVFCENTGNDIDAFVLEHRDRFESLVFNGNSFEKSLGKGYGEFLIIQYAMEHSVFLREANYIIKITGKLRIHNLNEIVCLNKVLFGNRGDLMMAVFPPEYERTADSRCFLGNHRFFRDFCERDNVINDSGGYYFEHLLYSVIQENRTSSIVLDFPLPLIIDGYSWTSGKKYFSKELSSLEKMKCLRDYCRLMRNKSHGGLFFVRSSFFLFVFSVAYILWKSFKRSARFIRGRRLKRC